MSPVNIRRLTGAFGLATVVLWLCQVPLDLVGTGPSVFDGAAFSEHLATVQAIAFARVLLSHGASICLLIFAAGLRHVLLERPDREWFGTLIFGVALSWFIVTLLADVFVGGAVLNAMAQDPDPSVTRALILAATLIKTGGTGFLLMSLFLAVTGFSTFGSSALPNWTSWLALLGAAVCALTASARLTGSVDSMQAYNAGGWVVAAVTSLSPTLWLLCVSVLLLFGQVRSSEGLQNEQDGVDERT